MGQFASAEEPFWRRDGFWTSAAVTRTDSQLWNALMGADVTLTPWMRRFDPMTLIWASAGVAGIDE